MARRPLLLSVLLLVLVLAAGFALAQGGYDLSWWTVDGGGGNSASGDYTVSGTIGQPDAGSMSGGQYELDSGFWNGSGAFPPLESHTYLPIVLH